MTETQTTTATVSSATESNTADAREPIEATVERTVASVVRIGRLWAVYGLEAGRASLQATGETLKATSEILRDLSKRIDDHAADRRESDAVTR